MSAYVYYILTIFLYLFILLVPATESISFIDTVRGYIWRSGVFNGIIFHLALGFILYVTMKMSSIKKLILLTLIPAISYLLLLAISVVMGNLKSELEAIDLVLIAIAISTCAIFAGNLIGLFWSKLSRPVIAIESETPGNDDS